jgi:peptide/nickel transport system ATP-binding protein
VSAARPLVEVRDLGVDFDVAARGWFGGHRRLRAVDGVTLDIQRGETLALVGESGCGKTTLGRALLRLYAPSTGSIAYDGRDLATLTRDEQRDFRRRVQMVFQDPFTSLNPRMKVRDILTEPLRANGVGGPRERDRRAAELLELVGLPASALQRFPHAFSGGQRQRIGIARALALEPELIVADEPVSALDVSIQAQILNLLRDLQSELGLTVLLIAHDLAVVRQVADRVAVMYLGRVVEVAERDALFDRPLHPYTQSLLASVPIPDPVRERERPRVVLEGDVPSSIAPPAGCRFHPRCPVAAERCGVDDPPLVRGASGRSTACLLVPEP